VIHQDTLPSAATDLPAAGALICNGMGNPGSDVLQVKISNVLVDV
jgi:hypothetical protein